MSFTDVLRNDSLKSWRRQAFLTGGLIYAVFAVFVAYSLATGTTRSSAVSSVGHVFVGAGWTSAFIGLLGFHSSLADESPGLARLGSVGAVVGAVTMAVMAVASVVYLSGTVSGHISDVLLYLLPGVFVGIVFGFGSYGMAILQTRAVKRSIGALFLVLPTTFLCNVSRSLAGVDALVITLVVVSILSLTMLAISHQIGAGAGVASRQHS